jgi:hypothetical protein
LKRPTEKRELGRLLVLAKGLASRYRWRDAARAYERAIVQARHAADFESVVILGRELGRCHVKSAFQSAKKTDFVKRIRLAESAYLRSIKSAGGLAKPLRLAFSAQLKGLLSQARSSRSSDRHERHRLLGESSRALQDALDRFEKLGRDDEAIVVSLDCLEALSQELNMEWSPPERRGIITEALGVGAEVLLKKSATKSHLAWASYYIGKFEHMQVYLISDSDARDVTKKESVDHSARAVELSAARDDRLLISRASISAISAIGYLHRSDELFKKHLVVALESARITGDCRLIGDALSATAYDMAWQMTYEEIPERRIAVLEECKRLVVEAVDKYNAILCAEGVAAAYGIALVQAYTFASVVVEKAERIEILKEAARIGDAALQSFALSGSIGLVGPLDNTPAQYLAYILIEQALLSTDETQKKAEFAQAASLMDEVLRYRDAFSPFNRWDKAIDLDTEASIQVELSRIGTDRQQSIELLKAGSAKEREAIGLCRLDFAPSQEIPRNSAAAMASIATRVFRAYRELYGLTGEKESRDAMVGALRETAILYEKADSPSRAAQAHWRMGQFLDGERAHVEAAAEFETASRLFGEAAEDLAQFGEYFTDYSRYMKAWSLIDGARAKTALQNYEGASAEYGSASDLLRNTRRWKDASNYFGAWGKLEMGEALSAKERFSDAILAFEGARDLFSKRDETATQDDRSSLITVEEQLDLPRLSQTRKSYCQGRATLEMARMFDLEEEKPKASSQYGLASSIFRGIAEDVQKGSDRDEFLSMSLLCQGWRLMKEAEVNHSAARFGEAARCFDEAAKLRVAERLASIATANSHYCDAMRLGVEFGETGDPDAYEKAKNHMEAARSGYSEAELHRNAVWTEAAMSILDSRLYLFKGEKSGNPAERAKFYGMTERSLKFALSLAEKAGYKPRMILVEKELSRVRRKTKVAEDLAQMLTAPPIMGAGNLVQAQRSEEAKGITAFEGVNLQGQLRHEGQVEVGGTLDVQLDVFNSGSRPASLLRVDEMAPDGLQLVSVQEPYLIEGTGLDTRERLIQPLRIQSFRVRLRAEDAGGKTLSPKLVYRDELGRVRTEPLLSTIIRVLPVSIFEFKNPAANLIFDALVKEFVSDYMREKLTLEHSGWRSRGQIAESSKVPRSALYEAPGKHGSPLYELLSRGLVELRNFRGHRGRGGEAVKLRILYDKDSVRRFVDRRVMKSG